VLKDEEENNDYKQEQQRKMIEYIHIEIHCIFPATVLIMPHS